MATLTTSELAAMLHRRSAPGDIGRALDAWRRAAVLADDLGLRQRASAWRNLAKQFERDQRSAGDGVLHRDGRRWIIEVGDHHAVAADLVGVRYLGALLTRPGTEVPAVELVGGAPVEQTNHDLIDRSALDAYRRRVGELDEALSRALNPARIERLRAERDALRDELSSVLALNGRSRRFADSSERARTAVRKAIARAIDAIAQSNRELGTELRATISTGRTCMYMPDPERPRQWTVRA